MHCSWKVVGSLRKLWRWEGSWAENERGIYNRKWIRDCICKGWNGQVTDASHSFFSNEFEFRKDRCGSKSTRGKRRVTAWIHNCFHSQLEPIRGYSPLWGGWWMISCFYIHYSHLFLENAEKGTVSTSIHSRDKHVSQLFGVAKTLDTNTHHADNRWLVVINESFAVAANK